MSIIESAESELARVNFGEGDSAVMLALLRAFFGQWDSGGGVSVASEVLMRLISGQPLTPLTGEADEWRDPMGDGELLQNVRCSTVFKTRQGFCFDGSGPENIAVTFPYNPVTRRVEMPIYEMEIPGAFADALGRGPAPDPALYRDLASGVSVTHVSINEVWPSSPEAKPAGGCP